MKKAILILVLLSTILFGCSGNLPESKIQDINSGTYKLSGIQVELRYDFPGGEDSIRSRDTTEIEFTVEIDYPSKPLGKQRKDTVRFDGLIGADAGEYQAAPGCLPPFCDAYAKIKGGELTFDLLRPGGRYYGRGFLGAETLILETHFRYRGIGIDYHLQGEKVED